MNELTEIEQNIIENLENSLVLDNPPKITQQRFDSIIDVLIKEDRRELMWRLCGTYSNYNYNKVIDYFIDKKDSWYVEELICFVDGELDQEYLVNKMIETKDKEFINDALSLCGHCMEAYLEPHLLKKIYLFLESY